MEENLIEKVNKEINSNSLDKFKEQIFPLSPNDENKKINKLDMLKDNKELTIILIGHCGNGLYHIFYYKYNNNLYEVCTWGLENPQIYYIKDLNETKKPPDSPNNLKKKELIIYE